MMNYLDEIIAIKDWRRKHKKCAFCKYLSLLIPPVPNCESGYLCAAKDKMVNPELPRPFCKLFKLKEVDNL